MYVIVFVVALLSIPVWFARRVLRVRDSAAVGERPGAGWIIALVVALVLDSLLALVFVYALAVFGCHGRYECPV